MSVPEPDIDRLFGLALDEFTGARNELARGLKSTGDADAAAAVQALPKPSVAAWTINQLARVDGKGVKALLAAGEALRTAQGRLLAGEDAAAELRDASTQEREAVTELTRRAEAVLRESGRTATQTTLDRIAATLRAAALTDDGRRLLEAGRLTGELEPPGFDELAGAGRPIRRRTTQRATADRRRRHEQDQQRKRELREQARLLEREAREAEHEADRAEAVAREARRRAEQARAQANTAAELAKR
jgi:hypothetical protein